MSGEYKKHLRMIEQLKKSVAPTRESVNTEEVSEIIHTNVGDAISALREQMNVVSAAMSATDIEAMDICPKLRVMKRLITVVLAKLEVDNA